MKATFLIIYTLAFAWEGCGQWTDWYDYDNPDVGFGDFELTLQQGNILAPCSGQSIDKIECVVSDDSLCVQSMPRCAEEQEVESALDKGCWCNNTRQPVLHGVQCVCCDYKVRYHCTDNVGANTPIDSMPKILHVWPTQGPVAGGTLVTVSGNGLDAYGRPLVYLQNTRCNTVEVRTVSMTSSDPMDKADLQKGITTHVICNTPPLSRTSYRLGQQLPVSVRYLSAQEVLDSDYNFHYGANPVITSVEPRQTILSGGIVQTIRGTYLDTVANPVLIIYMYYDNVPKESYEETCRVTSQYYECPTPALDLQVLKDYKNYGYNTGGTSNNTAGIPPIHRRRRRQTGQNVPLVTGPGAKINDNPELDFFLGLKLDGYPKYEHLSQQIPEYSQIAVYIDPTLQPFEEPDRVKAFRPYWPFNHQTVDIKGEQLTTGLLLSDYTVHTGADECPIMDLLDNRLTMKPPEFEPTPMDEPPSPHPEVQVELGNLLFSIGYLDYENSLWDYEYARYGIIAGAVLVFILLITLIILCILRSKRIKEEEKKAQSKKTQNGSKPRVSESVV